MYHDYEIAELPKNLESAVYAALRNLPDQENCNRVRYFPAIPGIAGEEVRIYQRNHSVLIRLDDYR